MPQTYTNPAFSDRCGLAGVHTHGPYMVLPPRPPGSYAVTCPCCGRDDTDGSDGPMLCPDCAIPAVPADESTKADTAEDDADPPDGRF